jgi:hypothetical protein
MGVALLISQLVGCASFRSVGNNESYVVGPDGEKWTVSITRSGYVKYTHPDGHIIEVDNRGREGFLEGAAKLITLKELSD